jgi:hypothetical protein
MRVHWIASGYALAMTTKRAFWTVSVPDDKKLISHVVGKRPGDRKIDFPRRGKAFRRSNSSFPTSWETIPPTRSVIANPQSEAIQCTRIDCFTLRIRNDGRDDLNGLKEFI